MRCLDQPSQEFMIKREGFTLCSTQYVAWLYGLINHSLLLFIYLSWTIIIYFWLGLLGIYVYRDCLSHSQFPRSTQIVAMTEKVCFLFAFVINCKYSFSSAFRLKSHVWHFWAVFSSLLQLSCRLNSLMEQHRWPAVFLYMTVLQTWKLVLDPSWIRL